MGTDLESLGRKVDGLISEVGRQGALNESRFEKIDHQFGKIDDQLHRQGVLNESRFEKIDDQLHRQGVLNESRFEKIDDQLHRQGVLNESRFQKIEDEIGRQGVLGEERDGKLDVVLDVVLRINERLADKDGIGSTVKDHEFRIRALEKKAAQKA